MTQLLHEERLGFKTQSQTKNCPIVNLKTFEKRIPLNQRYDFNEPIIKLGRRGLNNVNTVANSKPKQKRKGRVKTTNASHSVQPLRNRNK
jgi:hypothetical protein